MNSTIFSDTMSKMALMLQSKGFAYIIPEHILWCVMDEEEFMKVARHCGAHLDTLRQELFVYINRQEKCSDPHEIVPTQEYMDTVRNINSLADREFSEVRMGHILLALIDNGEESFASYQLRKCGMTREKVAEYMRTGERGSLEKYAVDLTALAREGRLDRLVGRERELDRLVQILHKRRAPSPVILSQPGVGKTALVEGLAQRIADGNVPDTLTGASIWSLNVPGMLAGCSLRGEFEDRLEKCIKDVLSGGRTIIFIDEIHMLMGAGDGNGGMCASSILKPYLARGDIKCIGATTYDEYNKFVSRDRAFARRFSRIDLQEPTAIETIEILKGVRGTYEKFHNVRYSDKVLSRIVELTGRYLCDRCFPDKAIEVMDELGSGFRLGLYKKKTLDVSDVETQISRMANLPNAEECRKDGKALLKNLESSIKQELFGQDTVVEDVVRRVKAARAGFTSRERPLGVFALCGPTGCGKTELARLMAKNLHCPMVRFDMGEYSEENSVARLVGTSHGYVGFEEGGLLTNRVMESPECVLLFDEIEKAHQSVYNILLQVMDEGRLTDNRGRLVSFKNTLIFMTSNTGSRAYSSGGVTLGFEPVSRGESIAKEELAREFPPEFRNRFTAMFMFNPLNMETLERIVDKNMQRINESMADREIVVRLTDGARSYIARQAGKENMGGRPVERLVDRLVTEQLVDRVLFEDLCYTTILFDAGEGGFLIVGEEHNGKTEDGGSDTSGGKKACGGRRCPGGEVPCGAAPAKGRRKKAVQA